MGGNSPGKADSIDWPTTYRRLYIALDVRWSSPWDDEMSSVNKVVYWDEASVAPSTGSFFMNFRGSKRIDVVLQHAQGYQVFPSDSAPYDTQRILPWLDKGESYATESPVALDTDHRIEILCDGSTAGAGAANDAANPANGRLRVWLDGVLQFDLGGVRYRASGDTQFNGFLIDPIWGGGGDVKASSDWIEFDRVYVSGSND
jgi:hypothetical protein